MKKILFGAALWAVPLLSFAQGSAPRLSPIRDFVASVGGIVADLIPILIGVALIVFFWGLIMYVSKSGGGKAGDRGKKTMIAGLISLFIMVSVYGIIRLAQNALSIDSDPNIQAPRLPLR